ncbi:MAG: hypothetical protein ACI8QC_003634 [Planctomycetota bacterium]|jgi:hypothetical protein
MASGTQARRFRLDQSLRTWEVGAFVLAVVLGRYLALGSGQPGALDWVDLRYAQNLAAGRGFVFTPGAMWEPSGGATAPGFVGLLGWVAIWFGGCLEAARSLGVLADGVSALLIAGLLAHRPWAARAGLMFFALLPLCMGAPAAGNSGPLSLSLVLAALVSHGAGSMALAGGLAAVATLLRPELALLAPCLAVMSSRGLRSALLLLVPSATALALFFFGQSWLFGGGSWSAPTARMQLSDAGLIEHWSSLARAAMGGLPGLLLAPLALYGLYRCLQIGERMCLSLVLFCISFVSVGTLTALPATDGGLHVLRLCWLLLAGIGIEGTLRERRLERVRLGLATGVLAVAVVLAVGGPKLEPSLPKQADLLAWAAEVGLHEHSLFTLDGAALAYLSDGRVIAAQGGAWPLYQDHAVREAWLRETQPDYLLLEVARDGIGWVYGKEQLARAYYPVRRFSSSGHEDRNPDLRHLPLRAPQDLLLFKRHGLAFQ